MENLLRYELPSFWILTILLGLWHDQKQSNIGHLCSVNGASWAWFFGFSYNMISYNMIYIWGCCRLLHITTAQKIFCFNFLLYIIPVGSYKLHWTYHSGEGRVYIEEINNYALRPCPIRVTFFLGGGMQGFNPEPFKWHFQYHGIFLLW